MDWLWLDLQVRMKKSHYPSPTLSCAMFNAGTVLRKEPQLVLTKTLFACFQSVALVGVIITAESQQHMAVGWGEEQQSRTEAQPQK